MGDEDKGKKKKGFFGGGKEDDAAVDEAPAADEVAPEVVEEKSEADQKAADEAAEKKAAKEAADKEAADVKAAGVAAAKKKAAVDPLGLADKKVKVAKAADAPKSMEELVARSRGAWKKFRTTRVKKWSWISPEKSLLGNMANNAMNLGLAKKGASKGDVMNVLGGMIHSELTKKEEAPAADAE